MKKYITSAIPYVNAPPHIGHALEFVQADTLRRFYKDVLQEETLYLSGSDENALKNVQAAEKEGLSVQELVDKNTKLFQELADKLNVKFDVFQRGSDQEKHFVSSQKLWKLCSDNGYIYKGKYEGLYCVGCEAFYTADELDENGECFEHPGQKLEKVSEENWFFKLSEFQDDIRNWIEKDTLKIFPESRKNEVLSFLKNPLKDISISRSNERAKNWGVPVPGDKTQRMYVWFDALNIYQSGIGFGWDEKKYKKWWPADIHVIGKGIIRFHAVYWPAFLKAAGLKIPKSIFVHSYVNVEGKKMSKSVGNVIDPFKVIEQWGTDALRYYLLREIPPFEDGNYSDQRMQELYDSDLANELGNLISRVTNIAEEDGIDGNQIEDNSSAYERDKSTIEIHIRNFQFNVALGYIWGTIKRLNKNLNEKAPWKETKFGRKVFIINTIRNIREIGRMLIPFLPETAERIIASTRGQIKKVAPLFPKG